MEETNMLGSKEEVEEGVGEDPGAEIWFAVVDGMCSVEDAITARTGHQPTHELAVMAAICGPIPDAKTAAASSPLRVVPVSTARRWKGVGVAFPWLAAAACLAFIFALPDRSGVDRDDSDMMAEIEREHRAVAMLHLGVTNGETHHLGPKEYKDVPKFSPGDTIEIHGTTEAAQPPRLERAGGRDLDPDVVVRLADMSLVCRSGEHDAREGFVWRCEVPRSAGPATLQVCAYNVKYPETCRTIAAVEVVAEDVP